MSKINEGVNRGFQPEKIASTGGKGQIKGTLCPIPPVIVDVHKKDSSPFDFQSKRVFYNPISKSHYEDPENPYLVREHNMHFTVTQQPGDGDCLFHSVATLLQMDGHTGPFIRKECVMFLTANPSFIPHDNPFEANDQKLTLRDWVNIQESNEEVVNDNPAGDFDHYLSLMSTTKKFASSVEMLIISHLYQVNIRTYNPARGNEISYATTHMNPSNQGCSSHTPGNTLHLLRLHGNHYVSLTLTTKSTTPSPLPLSLDRITPSNTKGDEGNKDKNPKESGVIGNVSNLLVSSPYKNSRPIGPHLSPIPSNTMTTKGCEVWKDGRDQRRGLTHTPLPPSHLHRPTTTYREVLLNANNQRDLIAGTSGLEKLRICKGLLSSLTHDCCPDTQTIPAPKISYNSNSRLGSKGTGRSDKVRKGGRFVIKPPEQPILTPLKNDRPPSSPLPAPKGVINTQRDREVRKRGESCVHIAENEKGTGPEIPPQLPTASSPNNVDLMTKTLCIWNLELHLVPDVWDLIQRATSPLVFKGIISVRRICQKNRRIRFEIDAKSESFDKLLEQLSKVSTARRYAWKVFVKDFDISKKLALSKMAGPGPGAHAPLAIASYNINSLMTKRPQLEMYLAENKIDIAGIQETRHRGDYWRVNLQGFNCIERTADKTVPGSRGLLLVVKKGITAFPVGKSSPHFITARVFGRDIIQPTLVITVYIPHAKCLSGGVADYEAQKRVLQELADNISGLQAKYPLDPIVVMGDFNRKKSSLRRFISDTDLVMCAFEGNSKTCKKGSSEEPIDHFMVSHSHTSLMTDIHVDQSIDLSDHWPIRASLHLRRRVPDSQGFQKPLRWKVLRTKLTPINEIANHNFWLPLVDGDIDEQSVEPEEGPETVRDKVIKLGRKFAQTCNKIGVEVGFLKPRGQLRQIQVSKPHASAIKERRRIYCSLKTISKRHNPTEHAEMTQALFDQRKKANNIAREERKQMWSKSVIKYDDCDPHDLKNNWRWLLQTAGWKTKARSETLKPMRDPNGILQLEGEQVREVWRQHFSALAADETGHSQCADYWTHLFPDPPDRRPTLDCLNVDISRPELVRALRFMKMDKAPGPDAIPVDFFKHFLTYQSSPPENVPDVDIIDGSLALNKLLELIQLIWIEGCVPTELNVAILIAILKKGDPTDCGNYRGISLMDSVIKVLISTLTVRLTDTMETEGLISRAQAGFRRREECANQCVALFEIIKRRMNAGLPTYALFLDFQKAYDTVPHQALFRKLDVLGVRGRFALFIIGLYSESSVVVRTNDGVYSAPFSLKKGLRQGCPMSPILFDMFINDIFDDCEGHGVRIPQKLTKGQMDLEGLGYLKQGWSPHKRRKKLVDQRIPGLLFADDGVGLADDEYSLFCIKRIVCAWAKKHEMTFGVQKCGLMEFKDHDMIMEEEAFIDKDKWSINGEVLPTPEFYRYLGLDFYIDLDVHKMSLPRLQLARAALHDIGPFLRCPTIPVRMKVKLVRLCIITTMTYGAELWGMNAKRAVQMDRVISTACRWILGTTGPVQQVAIGALRAEIGLPWIRTITAVARARAFIKFRDLKTWISELIRYPLKSRQGTWTTNCITWLKKYVGVDKSDGPMDLKTFLINKDASLSLVQSCINTRVQVANIKSAPNTRLYFDSNFRSLFHNRKEGNSYPTFIPYFAPGLLLLSLFRANGYLSYFHLQQLKLEPTKKFCPFCDKRLDETRSHILFTCVAWRMERAKFLSRLTLLLFTEMKVTRKTARQLILGGCVNTNQEGVQVFLNDYYPSDGVEGPTEEERMTASFSDAESEERIPLWSTRGCYEVAGFLAAVHRKRIIKIKAIKTRADSSLTIGRGIGIRGKREYFLREVNNDGHCGQVLGG